MADVKIIILDEHRQYREGLKLLLEEMCAAKVVGLTGDAKEFMHMIRKTDVDVVFMNTNIPNTSGLKMIKQTLSEYPDLNIIVLSMYGDSEYLKMMLDAGVKGFVVNDINEKNENEFSQAIETVMQGKFYFSKEIPDRMNAQCA